MYIISLFVAKFELTANIMINVYLLMFQISTVENKVFSENDTKDNQPFETLKSVLENVKPNCGINVEIKYPMKKRVRFDLNNQKSILIFI